MRSALQRIFDLTGSKNRSQSGMPSDYVSFTTKDGKTRIRMTPDRSANAMAARHNYEMIYGDVPESFGMKQVVEVIDPKTGKFTPVTGDSRNIPSIETQLGALSSFQETGIIGPQPVNPDGSNAIGKTSGVADEVAQAAVMASPPPSQPAVTPSQSGYSSSAPSLDIVAPVQPELRYNHGAPASQLIAHSPLAAPSYPIPNGSPAQPPLIDSEQLISLSSRAKMPAPAPAPGQNPITTPSGQAVPKAASGSVLAAPQSIKNLFKAGPQ